MTKTTEELSRYSRQEGEKSFFYDFLMSVKDAQEKGKGDYYNEVLDLLLDNKGKGGNAVISRIGEISEKLGIANPYDQ